ncbi:MAG TPA: MG2 domain-containing protein, partial [Pyrinomonadaceae bacterium]|nr:MG2 domain-containing protein [Pyrinomonadaceae bacterium]
MPNNKIRRYLAAGIIYLAVVASVFGFNVIRARTAPPATPPPAEEAPKISLTTPYFSLTTNRSYSPNESARLWASYQNIDHLDFRVYRIKDPNKFFKQLDNPHEMGEKEKEQISQGYGARPSLLERTHRLKTSLFGAIKSYVRTHLQRQHRETFNQKFRKEPPAERTPLNVADYARVPLLNPDQKVKDWREKLPALENEYDSRMIPLGKMDPGVYLVEGVNGGMRAYSIAIVTNLTMIEKTNRRGQVMVYIVDRKSGAPREGVSVEITNANNTLTTGKTDKLGIFKTNVKLPEQPETPAEDFDPEESRSKPLLIMARESDNFVISDVDSFYFGGYGGGQDGLTSQDVTSFIYTDRPIYRPAQSVFFKGILRQWTTNGYKLLDSKTVKVTIEDPDAGKVFEKDLPLSDRGTFSGQLDMTEEAP